MSLTIQYNYPYDHPIWEQEPPAPVSLNTLEDTLSQNDHLSIIQSPDLFWQLFCREYVFKPDEERFCSEDFLNKMKEDVDLSISSANELMITGSPIEIDALKHSIELIRRICWRSLAVENKSTCRLIFKESRGERASIFDENDANGSLQKICKHDIYQHFIYENLPSLFERLGAKFEDRNMDVHYPFNGSPLVIKEIDKTPRLQGYYLEDLVCFITWGKTFLIQPDVSPAEEMSFEEFMYGLYTRQDNVDVQLQSDDGGEYGLHKLILKYRGGSFSKVFEGKKCFKLDYSKELISAFIDYLYLGVPKFELKYKETHNFDIAKLYELALKYDIHGLATCCKRICFSSKDNKERQILDHWVRC